MSKLSDVDDIIYNQLVRLDRQMHDDKPENLKKVVDQSKAITGLSRQIIDINALRIKAAELKRRNRIEDIPEGFK